MQPMSIRHTMLPGGKSDTASPPAQPHLCTTGLESSVSRRWKAKRPTNGTSLSMAISTLVIKRPAEGITTCVPPTVHEALPPCRTLSTYPAWGST